jgi:hypothetical protein
VKKTFSVPIKYEQQTFQDDRFLKLKIYVMHDGVNLNESSFDIDAMERAKESIKNVPILAFVREVDGENDKDFAGHEMELIYKDDEYKFKYLGRPVGVIPADDNNYHYETIEDQTFVVVDGYVWKDYANDALDILEQDEVKSQSMEISVNSYSFSEDGICNITDYRYTGVCLLGDDVTPAMTHARAEVITPQVFNKSKMKEAISDMLTELKYTLNETPTFEIEGGNEMEKENQSVEEILETNEEFKAKDKKDAKEPELDKEDVAEPKEKMEDKKDQADDNDGDENGKDADNDGDGAIDYQVEYEAIKAKYEALESELGKLKDEFSSTSDELEGLRKFKADAIAAEREAEETEIFEKFSNELTEDEMQPIKDKASEYSIEDLEDKLFALAGRKKVKFSAKQKSERISMGVFEVKQDVVTDSKSIWAEQKEKFSSK